MKILTVIDNFPPYSSAGAESVAFRFSLAYQKLGHEVFVFTATAHADQAGPFEYEGLQGERILLPKHERFRAKNMIKNPAALTLLAACLEKQKPNMAHLHNVHEFLSYETIPFLADRGLKPVVTLHDCMSFHYGKFSEGFNPNDLSDNPKVNLKVSALAQLKRFRTRFWPGRNNAHRKALAKAHQVVSVSGYLKDALTQNNMPCHRVIHNGLDLADWHPHIKPTSKTIADLNFQDAPVIFFGGRLSPDKGIYPMIQAFQKVHQKNPQTKLLLAGAQIGNLEKFIPPPYDCLENIIQTGWLGPQDMQAALMASCVVAVPSTCLDCFPTLNLEAMALAKPVVATCFGGSTEQVIHGETGFLVNPFNTEKLAQHCLTLIENPAQAQAMGQAGAKRLQTHFDINAKAQEYVQLWA